MIVDTLRKFLEENGISGPVLLAVSGGPDSTALLLAAVDAGVPIIAAHVNHHLRGPESDEDEAFVRDLCKRIGVPLHVADGSVDPEQIRQHGVEAAAREVRHARLQKLRGETGASHIATAHQKNDQAETIVMRLMTGGGLAGLRGIHPIRADGVIRPLLDISRAEIEAFLRQRGVTARFDRSNTDPRFLRNRVRAVLAQLEPHLIDSLASVAGQAREQWSKLEQLLDAVDNTTQTNDETRFLSFPADAWLRQALLLRHIRRLEPHSREVGAADLERIAAQLDSLKRVSVTGDLELLRRGREWILRRVPSPVSPFEFEVRVDESVAVAIPSGRLVLRRVSAEGPPSKMRGGSFASLRTQFQIPDDADPTFVVRNRRQGDKFQPLGMTKEKKLKDFLIDRKIPSESRDRIPLLVWNGIIVCVAGVEISEAFKVTGSGGERYEVSIEETDQEGIQRKKD